MEDFDGKQLRRTFFEKPQEQTPDYRSAKAAREAKQRAKREAKIANKQRRAA